MDQGQDSQYSGEMHHNNGLIMAGVIGKLDTLLRRVKYVPRQFQRPNTEEEKAHNLENLRKAIQSARKRYPDLDLSLYEYETQGGKSRHRRSRRNKKQSKRSGKNNKKRKTSRSRKMRKTRRNNKTRTSRVVKTK